MKDRWSQQNSWLIVCSNKVMSPHLLKIRLKNQSSSNLSRIHRSPADQIDIIIGLLYGCAHRMSIKITIFNANQSGACGPGLNCVQELSQPANNNWCIAQRTCQTWDDQKVESGWDLLFWQTCQTVYRWQIHF